MANTEWEALKTTPNDMEFGKDIQAIHCDTKDFYILRSLNKPEFNKNPRCNYEYWRNEGIKRINSKKKKKNRSNYAIDGYDRDWRYLEADVKNCRNWELKYIRFIRNNNVEDEFIVCNSYLTPIHYKEVLEKAEII